MISTCQLFLIAVAIATASGQTVYVNSSARNYYRLAQRELLHDVEIVELEIAAVDARFDDRLDVILYQQQQTLKTIQNLTSYEEAKSELEVCEARAQFMAKYYTIRANTTASLARDYATSELERRVSSCDNYYANNQTGLELCYVQYVTESTEIVDGYLKKARNDLNTSLFNARGYARTGVKCSFLVEKEVLQAIAITAQNGAAVSLPSDAKHMAGQDEIRKTTSGR